MKTLIIAEAGVNHNGDIALTKQLIIETKKSGADYVILQTYSTGVIVNGQATIRNYCFVGSTL